MPQGILFLCPFPKTASALRYQGDTTIAKAGEVLYFTNVMTTKQNGKTW